MGYTHKKFRTFLSINRWVLLIHQDSPQSIHTKIETKEFTLNKNLEYLFNMLKITPSPIGCGRNKLTAESDDSCDEDKQGGQ